MMSVASPQRRAREAPSHTPDARPSQRVSGASPEGHPAVGTPCWRRPPRLRALRQHRRAAPQLVAQPPSVAVGAKQMEKTPQTHVHLAAPARHPPRAGALRRRLFDLAASHDTQPSAAAAVPAAHAGTAAARRRRKLSRVVTQLSGAREQAAAHAAAGAGCGSRDGRAGEGRPPRERGAGRRAQWRSRRRRAPPPWARALDAVGASQRNIVLAWSRVTMII
jgi:hypothetical protein